MERGLGAGGHLRVRPLGSARAHLLDRHAAADRERLAARRARLLLHPHRRRGAVPAHARARGLLPHGMGRQRPADRASCPEPLRRSLRSVCAVRPRVRPARVTLRQGPGVDLAPQLRRAVPAADRDGRARLRRAVADARPVRRLVDDLHDDRAGGAAHLATLVPGAPGARAGLSAGGAHALGRRLPDRGRAGRARGPGAPRRDAPGPLRGGWGSRQRRRADRHHPPRADPGLRGAAGPSRRRAPRRARRRHRDDAVVRHQRPRQEPSPRGAGQGHRPRDGLHLRRSHRRHVVARAGPPGAGDPRHGRALAGRPLGKPRVGVRGRRAGAGRLLRARRLERQPGTAPHRRAARGVG